VAQPFRKERLMGEHGALATGCEFVGYRAAPCGIYYVDLSP